MRKNFIFLNLFIVFLLVNQKIFAFEFQYGTQAASLIRMNLDTSFNLFTYILLSGLYIMISHFAFLNLSEFSLMMMIGFFVFGGVIGLWLGYEAGLIVAIILSLLFVSGPKKEML